MFGVWYTYCERRIKMIFICMTALCIIGVINIGLFIYMVYDVLKIHRELVKLEKNNRKEEELRK